VDCVGTWQGGRGVSDYGHLDVDHMDVVFPGAIGERRMHVATLSVADAGRRLTLDGVELERR
jgi:hypothetical protein